MEELPIKIHHHLKKKKTWGFLKAVKSRARSGLGKRSLSFCDTCFSITCSEVSAPHHRLCLFFRSCVMLSFVKQQLFTADKVRQRLTASALKSCMHTLSQGQSSPRSTEAAWVVLHHSRKYESRREQLSSFFSFSAFFVCRFLFIHTSTHLRSDTIIKKQADMRLFWPQSNGNNYKCNVQFSNLRFLKLVKLLNGQTGSASWLWMYKKTFIEL